MNPVIKNRIEKFNLKKMLKSEKIKLMQTLDYPDFLHLIAKSRGVITDSTGVEEECAALGKPCIVTNDFLQIPELEQSGIAKVTGCNYIGILGNLRKINDRRWKIKNKNILGKENVTKMIADKIISLERYSK
jgi:UDP-N-acetylglucosamine 2-epimerase (non-hydrolysing)